MVFYSFIALITYMNGMFLHDFHISICEIEYDQKEKSLKISQRIFLDDLEQGLTSRFEKSEIDLLNPKNVENLNKKIEVYVIENFTVKVNDKQTEMSFLGTQIRDDVLLCYIEIVGVKKLNSIEVKNTVLLDAFSDQVNLVHVQKDGRNKSLKLDSKTPVDVIKYK